MEERHEDSDGSNIFWPGYVDATTNLVLNLLFLLTIMIVAVFMFALELGRTSKVVEQKPPVAELRQEAARAAAAKAVALKARDRAVQAKNRTEKENLALKAELRRLRQELARRRRAESRAKKAKKKVVEASSRIRKPENGLRRAWGNDLGLVVRFREGAVDLNAAERERLRGLLKPVLTKKGGVTVRVGVRSGFSAARRIGFYRVMAVRNLLLEMKVPKDKIDVSVVERNDNPDSALVEVRPR